VPEATSSSRCSYYGNSCDRPPYGDDLCIFHVPKLCDNTKTNLDFYGALDEWITICDSKTPPESCDLRGFVFPEYVVAYKQFRNHMNFTDAHFTQGVSMRDITWQRGADFTGARFEKGLVLTRVTAHHAEFDPEPAKARIVRFGSSNVKFVRAEFAGEVRWEDVTVQGELDCSQAEFRMSTMMLRCSLGASTFAGGSFHSELRVYRTCLGNPSRFSYCAFDRDVCFAFGEKGRLGEQVTFDHITSSSALHLAFENLNLGDTSFQDTNIEAVTFRNIQWRPYGIFPFGVRHGLTDEQAVASRYSHRFDWRRDRYWLSRRNSDYELLAENYRQLVLNYEKKRDYVMAENFHIGEVETLRKRKKVPVNAYALYWLASRYGTSYVHAFATFALLLLMFGLAFMVTGFRIEGVGSNSGRIIRYAVARDYSRATPKQWLLDYGEACLFSSSAVAFARERAYQPIGPQSRLILYLAAIILNAQAGLIFLAIRRRFKR
jgi:uncharacterized protein YjbI with pentapeptide repeats